MRCAHGLSSRMDSIGQTLWPARSPPRSPRRRNPPAPSRRLSLRPHLQHGIREHDDALAGARARDQLRQRRRSENYSDAGEGESNWSIFNEAHFASNDVAKVQAHWPD
eukprot:1844822-Pleurochrysis_carterae.AAC.1